MSTDYRALCAELLNALENAIRVIHHEDGTQHISTADAVIAKADAALAQPETVGPMDEELEQLTEAMFSKGASLKELLRATIARYARPAIEPVPVSERLPGPEDCDAEGRCWFWGEQLSDSDDDWGWKLLDRTYGINWSGGPWLPARALPLPRQPAPAAPEP
jgi:hypothetical protein